jgi:radical SAM protein with 4Fe4S-binding SPASM domain
MTMEAVSYGEFSQALHAKFGNSRVPIDATLEVTRRCPLECQHCYNNLPMGDLDARNRELTKAEYFTLLTELAEMGVIWLLFTGGEIFARKDFLEIYTFAKQKGFLITLFTNGILVSEKIADYLKEYPPFAIEITLYGQTKQTYEALTQMPGSYERCMRGIRLLLDRGLPLKLKTVATTINKHEITAMKEFAEEELGAEFKFDSMLNPRIDCSRAPLGVRLSPEEVVALDFQAPKVISEYRKLLGAELQKAPIPKDTVYSCGGGIKSFAIDPFGHMSICVLSHQHTYDIRKGSVREGWVGFLWAVRQKKSTRPTKCNECRLHSVCSMCAANGELENGDAESPVEFLCEVAHLRAKTLGFEVPDHGDCEFCRSAERSAALQESVERIRSREISPEHWVAPREVLPILNNVASQTGCGGCGLH